jgi:hypothetical protein
MPNRSITSKSGLRKTAPTASGRTFWKRWLIHERFITTATALVLLIWVRRFLCRV